jgi:hypothetical protein
VRIFVLVHNWALSFSELLSSRRKCFRSVGSETPLRPMHIAISLWVVPSAAKFWTDLF